MLERLPDAHSGFLDFSQLSRASLLKAAVAALLLLLRWIFAMVSEFLTTSMSPILLPVDKQPYGIILGVRRQGEREVPSEDGQRRQRAPPAVPEVQALLFP